MHLRLAAPVDHHLAHTDHDARQYEKVDESQRHERAEDEGCYRRSQDVVGEVRRNADVLQPTPRPPLDVLLFGLVIDQLQMEEPV